MSGPLWVASYLFLASTVVFLSFAVAALYRTSGTAPATRSRELSWPFTYLRPGDPAPAWMNQPDASGAGLSLAVIAGVGQHDLATAASVAIAGRDAGVSWRLVISHEWRSQLAAPIPAELATDMLVINSDEFERVGLAATPVVAVIRDAHVVDAMAGTLGPAQVGRMLARFHVSDDMTVRPTIEAKAVTR